MKIEISRSKYRRKSKTFGLWLLAGLLLWTAVPAPAQDNDGFARDDAPLYPNAPRPREDFKRQDFEHRKGRRFREGFQKLRKQGKKVFALATIRKQFEKLGMGLGLSLQKLHSMSKIYADTPDVKALADARFDLRRGISAKLLQTERLEQRFRELRDEVLTDRVNHLSLRMNREEARNHIKERMAWTEEILGEVRETRMKAKEMLQNDELAFRATREIRKKRKRTGAALVGIILALIIGLVVVVFLALRYQRETVRLATIQAQRGTPNPTPPTVDPQLQSPPHPNLLAAPAPASPAALPPPATALSEAAPTSVPAPAPRAGDLKPGTVLNGIYRIESELGRGGMGVVYEATDTALQRKVAIKQMRDEIKEVTRDFELFIKEARLVASLRHPNLVEIYSILQENGDIFLIFEYVAGKTLRQVLNQSPGYRLAVPSVKRTVTQVAAALDYAHSKKVIHRDLKPSNIMITREGEARVMDFGIAHRAKMTVAKQTHTQAWGTPPYMAPEQELGTVSRESDLFALGVCFYEMLTGRLPYEGPNYLAQKSQMLFKPPTQTAPGLPAQTDAVIARLLASEPTQRYRTAREFVSALASIPG